MPITLLIHASSSLVNPSHQLIPSSEQADQQHRSEQPDQQRRTEFINQLRQLKRSNEPHQEEKDSHDRKRNIENRINTIRQRQRKYTHKIIRRGIDPRFNINIVKEILYRYGVPYIVVNISKSKMTGRIKNLFTTEYYDEFGVRHRC